ncbi:hypothetical protein A0H81_10239 [Grifola frondosa]|uniref:Uncharacterized protein n=1 Tax=Grifola frondosa TaxID=5627 RepID=A0A1C7M081_GRIFR|nr:hypothetical protein A0H81_10239 [Grifola frondosa]
MLTVYLFSLHGAARSPASSRSCLPILLTPATSSSALLEHIPSAGRSNRVRARRTGLTAKCRAHDGRRGAEETRTPTVRAIRPSTHPPGSTHAGATSRAPSPTLKPASTRAATLHPAHAGTCGVFPWRDRARVR